MPLVDKELVAELLNSGRFDARWYASTYRDLAETGMTPAEHYLWLGARLGRSPSAPQPPESIVSGLHGINGGKAAPLGRGDRDVDALFIDGTYGTSSTPYRVYRIANGLAHKGWAARWISGEEVASVLLCDLNPRLVVFHRAPYQGAFAELAQAMRARGGMIVFDVDDLVFDDTLVPLIDGFRRLTNAEKEGFLQGVRTYREFLFYADYCTVPTNYLARHIGELGKRVYRVRNAISPRNVRFFEQARYRRTMRPSPFVIGYYSGTRTHRADFALVAPALARFMFATPDVILRLVGELDLDDYPELRPFGEIRRHGDPPRVIRVGLMHHDAMMRDQLSCDLIIAPLELGNPFCEGKSELKFFEASLASCPVIASRTATFAEATQDGKFAKLAETSDDWLQAFRTTYSDYDCALSRARAAFDHVRQFYSRTFATGEALRAYEDHLAGYEGCLVEAPAEPSPSTLLGDLVEAVVNRAIRP